jgi:hypothetical protein
MARKAGQLISRGPRTWLVRVSLGRDPETGTRKYHNRTVHGSFREAQTYLNAKLQERDIGRLPRAAAIRLDDYLDQWLATSAKPRLRPKSYTDYESLLRLHIRPCLGARPLGAITQFDIQSVYARMFNRGLSPRTIEYTNAVLQSAFRQAVRWKMLAEDPCVGVDLPRLKRREMEALSVEECRRFLTVARESEWYALFALALTTEQADGNPGRLPVGSIQSVEPSEGNIRLNAGSGRSLCRRASSATRVSKYFGGGLDLNPTRGTPGSDRLTERGTPELSASSARDP